VDQGIEHHQYIPIVEVDQQGQPLPFSVGPEEWGRFLVRLYELWYPDRYRVSVRHFDAVLARLVDGTETICTLGRDCRSYFLVEHNGDVYPCDFFVEPGLRLGNIQDSGWEELRRSALYREFGAQKSRISQECSACSFLELCAGDCLKLRAVPAAVKGESRGEPGGVPGIPGGDPRAMSRLCGGWKAFYEHTLPGFRRLAREVQRQRSRELQEGMRRGYRQQLSGGSSPR
jgi:uncharacterized protein